MFVKSRVLIGGSVAVVAAVIGGIYLYKLPRAKMLTLEVLPEETLIDILHLIRKQYSKYYKKNQLYARKQRRKMLRGSDEYFKYVKECFGILDKLSDDARDDVLSQKSVKRDVFDDSMRLYKHEESVYEAAIDCKKFINKWPVSGDLTPDKLYEILTFYRNRLNSLPAAQNPCSLPLVLTLIEDEIYDEFKIEVEEIERGFDMHYQFLTEFNNLMQVIEQAKIVEEIEDIEIPNMSES